MTKKLLITLLILALFASCNVLRTTNPATFDEGVVINGVRWATRNVDMPGTFAENPKDAGMLFQWNRRKGWSATDESTEGWDNSIPEGTEWERQNDPCPRGWRVPTYEELGSLRRAGSVFTTLNGVSGNLYGTAPYQIFLPVTGVRNGRDSRDGRLLLARYGGNYWSSTGLGRGIAYDFHFSGWQPPPPEEGMMPDVVFEFIGRGRNDAIAIRCVSIN